MPPVAQFHTTDGQMQGINIELPEGYQIVLFASGQNDISPQENIVFTTPTAGDYKVIILDLESDTFYYVLTEQVEWL